MPFGIRLLGPLAVMVASCNAYDRSTYETLLDAALVADARADAFDAHDAGEDAGGIDAVAAALTDAALADRSDAFGDVVADGGLSDAPLIQDACTPTSTETCNGRDDNCDGVIDEGFDLMGDIANCGGCGVQCLLAHSAPACVAGRCVPMCTAGFADCDGIAANGCEADLSHPETCGRCGHACGVGARCDARGACSDEYPVALEAAGKTTCVLRANGTVWCWGNNRLGTVGDGTTTNRTMPVQVAGITTAVAITGSEHQRCALLRDGTVSCWGANVDGQLGDATNTNRPRPVAVFGLAGVTDIQSGLDHVCAIRGVTGAVMCWGANDDAQLGNGTTTSRNVPVAANETAAMQLGSYGSQTCARRANGSIDCWGRNVDGELGIGTVVSPSMTPAPVMGVSDAAEVEGGSTFTCARRTSGRVVCWGENSYGQMGDGTRDTVVRRTAPTMDVSGLVDAVQFAAGGAHVCALRASGGVACWGANGHGQLGDGTVATRTMPVATMGLGSAAVVQVSVGDFHSCALLADGTVRCWGENADGQLGDGTTTVRQVATVVVGLP